ncbi:MAG: hypothetical protein RMK01_04490 [Thermomicrobium sp.]|nr:hypothetical protein [Thermomicrobium sp.]
MERAVGGSWFPFRLDPETEARYVGLLRTVRAVQRERPCRAVPVPRRFCALRSVPHLRRWAVVIAAPSYLAGISRARALLAGVPEVVSCRVERIDSRAVRLVLMTVALARADVVGLAQRSLHRSGCPATVQVIDLGGPTENADLR